MLKADIALSDLSLPAEWREDRIALGHSRIVPYSHPLLETLLVRTHGQWFAVVRERCAPAAAGNAAASRDVDAATFARLYQESILWPLDYVLIEAAQAGCRMKLRAGVFGSVPVYCRASADRVTISWDFADFAAQSLAIDAEIASHRLVLQTVYSARQLCVGVNLLTERASLTVEPGRLNYRYPAPLEETTRAPLPEGRDALTEFDGQLQRAATARPVTADRLSLELSGGMDSATVACAMATMGRQMSSKGILLDGEIRPAQIQRRRRIAELLGLSDETVEMSAFPPALDLDHGPGHGQGLYWEYYLEACSALWDSAQAQGCTAIFSGIGGDELFPRYVDEVPAGAAAEPAVSTESRRCAERLLTARALSAARSLRGFDAPASPVPATALLAHACRGANLLRRGLWPVNPLSDPSLLAFCHRLPREHRHDREVMRQYLNARLGAAVFPAGYVKETFVDVLPGLISRHAKTLAAQLRECTLADLGLVDRGAALALLDTVATTRAQAPTAALAMFLWMERCVRQSG